MERSYFSSVLIRLSIALAVSATAWGQASQEEPSGREKKEFKFEVVSIRPLEGFPEGVPLGYAALSSTGFRTTASFYQLVIIAYGPPGGGVYASNSVKLRGGPGWFSETYYAVEAKVSEADLNAWQSQGKEQPLLRAGLRAALKERSNLAIHEEPTKQKNFEVSVAKGGPKLKLSDPKAVLPAGNRWPNGGISTPISPRDAGGNNFYGATVGDLVSFLSLVSGPVPIRDKTGLTGSYDFALRKVPGPEPTREDLIYAWELDALGLTIKAGTEVGSTIVVDHIDRPSSN